MSENKIEWRFPLSNRGQVRGISTGDVETFKKNPYANFGREIVQNSLDARLKNDEPIVVDFNLFDVNLNDIPDITGFRNAINNCIDYWKEVKSYQKEYGKILKKLQENKKIKCLRISDFNTTGLIGVENLSKPNNKFKALTKSTGVSNKDTKLSGGSKGVGKNAAFLLSGFNMVFYSTYTKDGFRGYMGVADLITGSANDGSGDYTQGKGYFSSDDDINPVYESFNIDKNFTRGNDFGTDIYIIDFKDDNEWSKEVLTSIIESFMYAIIKNDLNIKINNFLINSSNLKNIFDKSYLINQNKKDYLISLYRTLIGEGDVRSFVIETDLGDLNLFISVYKDVDKKYATHRCAMIRTPFMKIKDIKRLENLNWSGACIIGDNELGRKLLEIENPQHIDWEVNRLENTEKRQIKSILDNIEKEIEKDVESCFDLDKNSEIDPNGAGEFLAANDEGDSFNGLEKGLSSDKIKVTEIKRSKVLETQPEIEEDGAEGFMPDEGSIVEGNDETLHPESHNNSKGGGYHPGDDSSGKGDGENIVISKAPLKGVRYNFICLNKTEGIYKITFIPNLSSKECYLRLLQIDDDLSSKREVKILSLNVNGIDINFANDNEYGPFEIINAQKSILIIKTTENSYFSGEAIVYAIKE